MADLSGVYRPGLIEASNKRYTSFARSRIYPGYIAPASLKPERTGNPIGLGRNFLSLARSCIWVTEWAGQEAIRGMSAPGIQAHRIENYVKA